MNPLSIGADLLSKVGGSAIESLIPGLNKNQSNSGDGDDISAIKKILGAVMDKQQPVAAQ